jgi:hypothetical protein
MNPVFKQIQAFEITEILDEFENNEILIDESEVKLRNLHLKIGQLFTETRTI